MTGPHHIDDDQGERDTERPSLLDMATDEEGRVLPGRRSKVTLADGTTFVVRITNREFVAYDMTRAKRKWPPLSDAPFLGATFLAHRAALREGLTALSWDQWQEAVDALENLPEDEEDTEQGRPTR
jgi:hypothetical protein